MPATLQSRRMPQLFSALRLLDRHTVMKSALERFSDSLGSDWARDERRERRGEVRRERVVDTAIECLQRFSPAECRNCFRHCGYSIATQS